MATRAKFVCQSVTKMVGHGWYGVPPGGFIYAAKFTPVTGDTPENKEFFAATPTGSVELSTIREDHFVPGKSYYLDFTLAE